MFPNIDYVKLSKKFETLITKYGFVLIEILDQFLNLLPTVVTTFFPVTCIFAPFPQNGFYLIS